MWNNRERVAIWQIADITQASTNVAVAGETSRGPRKTCARGLYEEKLADVKTDQGKGMHRRVPCVWTRVVM